MSKTRIIALIVTVFSFIGIGSAHAEIRPGELNFTPLVGGYRFEGNQDIENDALIGGALGIYFTKIFGLEAMFNYIDTESKTTENGIDVYVYHLDALIYFWQNERFAPYLTFGGGGISTNPVGAKSDTNWLVDYGLGLKYWLIENLAIRGDVRGLIPFDSDNHYNNLSYSIGFTYRWGGAKPVVAEAPAEIAPPPAPEKVASKKEVCVYLDVYFDFDRAEIKPQYDKEIKKIADFMKAHPDIKATVRGYTDWVGTEEYNKLLSERRADSIKDYLVNHFDIDPGRITTVGFGENQPRATNETSFGRQLNRRASQVSCTFEITFQ
ncbi:MAG: OmpA family protein [Deltaproteobacteria bacterium]